MALTHAVALPEVAGDTESKAGSPAIAVLSWRSARTLSMARSAGRRAGGMRIGDCYFLSLM